MSIEIVMQVGDPPEERNPFWVRCEPCGHHWVAAYLPMPMAKAAKLLKAARCPNCAAGPKGLFMANGPAA